MSEKITPQHLDRKAYVYVRQSSPNQVRHHLESQRRQYSLVDCGRSLGFRRVEVIDEDLGISGSGRQERPGFARLLAAVCAGEAGAVLAADASRLARNNRDWHHLIDLCALTTTLVIDYDGVYDPQLLNDRLLLGLKGTMSEFELGLIRQRAQEALRQKIRRGEVLTEVPVGYTRTRENRCEMTADLQVQEAVRAVFSKFTELGSARQVLLWYRDEQLMLPSNQSGTSGREVSWCAPSYNRILSILRNPIYAGAFAYGRCQLTTRVVEGRARKVQGRALEPEKWHVLIQDHHEAYLSWSQYLQNQELLQQNSNMEGRITAGPAKRGPALLSGLLRCGRCGRKLVITYVGHRGSQLARYVCRSSHVRDASAKCISFASRRVDDAVSAALLEALRPAGVEAALEACEQQFSVVDSSRRQLQLDVEKARYLADRARRQYDAVEPENRLVATELERRWNEALAELSRLEHRLLEIGSTPPNLSEEEKRKLLDLGGDLETLWFHPQASPPIKKRILRTVLREIIVNLDSDPVVSG